MKKIKVLTAIILVIIGVMACEKILPQALSDDELLDGPVVGQIMSRTGGSLQVMWPLTTKYSLLKLV